ncbi:MAG: serine hydrolase domain-containing protein [Steroidobacter sp.]
MRRSAVVGLMLWMVCAPLLAATDEAEKYITAVESAQSPDRGGYDSRTLAQIMELARVPGASVAVIKDFKIHWAKGYGVADVESGAKVDTETLFQAASISKPVTAMAMLKQVQDGKFTLEDDINKILRSWKLDGGEFTKAQAVTPRLLASHTSGLGDGFGFPGYDPGAPLPSVLQILNGEKPSNVGRVFMERPPLQAHKYSGGGYTVLQLALTDTLRRPFPDILRDAVLGPIGMTRSFFEQPLSPDHDKNAARAHGGDGKGMGAKWHVYPELAAAGLWTTPTDLARFAIEVQRSTYGGSNRVLSPALTREMSSPVGVGDYGVGFSLGKRGEGWYFQHGGSNWGFLCYFLAHKTKGYGLVVMTNSDRGGPVLNEIRERVERAYGWDTLDKPVLR